MDVTVTISATALETLADAAYEWANEIENDIAPTSWAMGDDESAEMQELQAVEITEAFDLANTLLQAARKD